MLHLTPGLTAYLIFLFALMGLCMGSFLNAWAWRVTHGERISRGRSHCPTCGHTLGAVDLVPLFSYLLLRGRCRHCGARISWRYPAVELLSALVFVSLLLRYDISPTLLRFLALGCLLLLLALVDWETRELPDGPVLAVGLLALLRLWEEGMSALPDMLLGGVCIALPLLLLVLLMDKVLGKESMGGGDIKLIFVLGLHFGPWQMLLLLLLACVAGLLTPVVLRRKKPRGGEGAETRGVEDAAPYPATEEAETRGVEDEAEGGFPFGPSLALCAWPMALFGRQAIDWYLSLFF